MIALPSWVPFAALAAGAAAGATVIAVSLSVDGGGGGGAEEEEEVPGDLDVGGLTDPQPDGGGGGGGTDVGGGGGTDVSGGGGSPAPPPLSARRAALPPLTGGSGVEVVPRVGPVPPLHEHPHDGRMHFGPSPLLSMVVPDDPSVPMVTVEGWVARMRQGDDLVLSLLYTAERELQTMKLPLFFDPKVWTFVAFERGEGSEPARWIEDLAWDGVASTVFDPRTEPGEVCVKVRLRLNHRVGEGYEVDSHSVAVGGDSKSMNWLRLMHVGNPTPFNIGIEESRKVWFLRPDGSYSNWLPPFTALPARP